LLLLLLVIVSGALLGLWVKLNYLLLNHLKRKFQMLKSLKTKLAIAGASVLASASAFATDHTATINTAVTEGTANYTAVILGILGMCAVGFGVGLIISKLKN